MENKSIRGYSEDDCKPLTKSGLHEEVAWQGKTPISVKGQIVIKVSFHRRKTAATKMYALYLTSE